MGGIASAATVPDIPILVMALTKLNVNGLVPVISRMQTAQETLPGKAPWLAVRKVQPDAPQAVQMVVSSSFEFSVSEACQGVCCEPMMVRTG
jgi:hypothetical protein